MSVAIVTHNRALPIAWQAYDPNDYPPEGQVGVIMSLLHRLAPALPADCEVVVLLDRGLGCSPQLLAHIAQMGWYFVARVPGTVRLRTTDGMQTPCATGHLSKAHRLIPIAESKFIKSRTNVNPLLQVPPASRGNQVGARLGSPRKAGGNLKEGGN